MRGPARQAAGAVARALALLLVAGGCGRDPAGATRFERAPILLVSIDTLRADRLGCYGYARGTSPHIDRVAAEGVVFEDCYSNSPKTASSHMSLFTSLPPSAHGVTNASARLGIRVREVGANRRTLPQVLHASGYRATGYAAGANLNPQMGFARGFEGRFASRNEDVADLVERALPLSVLARTRDEPFFWFLHTYQVHGPYLPPDEYRARFAPEPVGRAGELMEAMRGLTHAQAWGRMHAGLWDHRDEFGPQDARYLSDLYDGEIAYTDSQLGRLFDALRADGTWDELLVVILSDHGEEFAEHGDYEHDQLFAEHLHVPWIVKLPGGAHAGTRVRGLTSLLDVMPTLLELVGVEGPPTMTGRSQVDAIRSGRTDGHAVLSERVMFADDYRASLRTPHSSVQFHAASRALLGFDLRADPGEHADVSGDAPWFDEAARALHDAVADAFELREALDAEDAGAEVELDAARLDELAEMGYVGEGTTGAAPSGSPLDAWPRR